MKFLPVLLVIVFLSKYALADDLQRLGQELMELRTANETLHAQIESDKKQYQSELQSLIAQKAELDSQIQRENLRAKQLAQKIRETKKRVKVDTVDDDKLRTVLIEVLPLIKAYVNKGLPFQITNRIKELDELETQLKAGLVPPQKIASRMWSFIEDEYRLTRESGLYQQTITLDEKEMLAEVARIGMTFMYTRTEGGTISQAMKNEDGRWFFTTFTQPDEQKMVHKLFESFRKQIRVGYFELPGKVPYKAVKGGDNASL